LSKHAILTTLNSRQEESDRWDHCANTFYNRILLLFV